MKKIWGVEKKLYIFKVMRVMRANPFRPALGPRGQRIMRGGPKRASRLK